MKPTRSFFFVLCLIFCVTLQPLLAVSAPSSSATSPSSAPAPAPQASSKTTHKAGSRSSTGSEGSNSGHKAGSHSGAGSGGSNTVHQAGSRSAGTSPPQHKAKTAGGEGKTGSSSVPKLIMQACEEATNQALCHHVLESVPESSKTNQNLKGLAVIALKETYKSMDTTSTFIKKEVGNPDLDPDTQQGLSDCQEAYLTIADQVVASIDAMLSQKYTEADKFLKVALAEIETCSGGLARSAPVAVKNYAVHQVCSTALSIVHVASKK